MPALLQDACVYCVCNSTMCPEIVHGVIYNVHVHVHVGSKEEMERSAELFLEGSVTEHAVTCRRDNRSKAKKRTCKCAIFCLMITRSHSLHLYM